MSKSKLQISIKKDSSGHDVELDGLSVYASMSFVKLINSLNNIAQLQGSNPDVKIKITRGSACVSLEAPEAAFDTIQSNFLKVVSYNSRDAAYIDSFKEIQEVISANGLEYEALIEYKGIKTLVTDKFKQDRIFRIARSKKRDSNTRISFIEGKLIGIGGKKPNIHIEINNKSTTIGCTEQEAIRINSLLYRNIKLSVWQKIYEDGDEEFFFCDHFVNDELYNEFKDFINNNFKLSGTEKFKNLHYKIRDLILHSRMGELKKLIKLFCNEDIDVGRLRTILIIMKPYLYETEFEDLLETISHNLQKKIKKPLF